MGYLLLKSKTPALTFVLCLFFRYAKQDILVHEFCHAIHLMGAVFTIEGFQRRLISAYNDAKKNERFKGLYAATNKNEYFVSIYDSRGPCF